MLVTTYLPWLIPCAYLLVAALASGRRPRTLWPIAEVVAALATVTALIVMSFDVAEAKGPLLGATGSVVLLVTTLGWIITRYSRVYLQGESGQPRYIAALFFTLSSIGTVVFAPRLDVLTGAWIASSAGLHQLLTFYQDRVPALIAAHKKFIASRAADLCMMVALLLVHYQCGSFSFADLRMHVSALPQPAPELQIAMLLIVFGVILKSAQLPVHGWLIQVMEAPTPVSALLHAGIVNIGGFVLIRMSMLLDQVMLARWLLVVMGTLTAVFASLVMMTRISIKVRLAWSTCAQMGFMLMECGLGFYDLALLHLLSHSLYKAYAFLSAGDTVLITGRDQLLTANAMDARAGFMMRMIMVPVTLAVVSVVALLWMGMLPGVQISAVLLFVISLGLAPLLWSSNVTGHRHLMRGLLLQFMLMNLYFFWHWLVARHITSSANASSADAPPALLAFVVICFALLYVAQCWLSCFPQSSLARRWYPRAYAGFYLDELFTRLTFILWPPRLYNAMQSSDSRGAVNVFK